VKKPARIASMTVLLALAGGASLVAACGSPHEAAPYTGKVPSLDTPAKQRGELVFAQNCNQCHPGGEGGLGPALNSKPAPVAAIKLVVRTGPAAMPSFGEDEISASDLDAVARYVVALRETKSEGKPVRQ
jgi:mono/diheme cytochrome c family protein